jgi:hypothetical protein
MNRREDDAGRAMRVVAQKRVQPSPSVSMKMLRLSSAQPQSTSESFPRFLPS